MGEWNTISGQALSGFMIVRGDAVPLKYGESRMFPREQVIDQPLTDFFLRQESFQELVAKQEHDLNRVGPGDREKGAVGEEEAVSHERVQVRVETGRIIAEGLDRGDHGRMRLFACRGTSGLGRGGKEDLLDGLVEAPAQLAQELALVLETEAQHLGNGDDILTDGDLAQDLLYVLGKQQGPLLVAGWTEASALTTIRQ